MDSEMNALLKGKNAQKQEERDESERDQLLKEIEEGYESDEEVGQNMKHEKLAQSMTKMAKGKLTEEKIKEKIEKHKRPANLEFNVPKVNPEIWGMMEYFAKTQDLRLQKQQKLLTKAACALAKAADSVITTV